MPNNKKKRKKVKSRKSLNRRLAVVVTAALIAASASFFIIRLAVRSIRKDVLPVQSEKNIIKQEPSLLIEEHDSDRLEEISSVDSRTAEQEPEEPEERMAQALSVEIPETKETETPENPDPKPEKPEEPEEDLLAVAEPVPEVSLISDNEPEGFTEPEKEIVPAKKEEEIKIEEPEPEEELEENEPEIKAEAQAAEVEKTELIAEVVQQPEKKPEVIKEPEPESEPAPEPDKKPELEAEPEKPAEIEKEPEAIEELQPEPEPAPEPIKEPEEQPESVIPAAEPEQEIKPEPEREPKREILLADRQPAVEEPVIIEKADPFFQISKPEQDSFYKKKINIEGKLGNSSSDKNAVNHIVSATWEIPGVSNPEELIFGSDGIFFISYQTAALTGKISVVFRIKHASDTIISRELVLFDGLVQPELTVITPAESSEYGGAVRISGKLTDPSALELGYRTPESFTYDIYSPADSSQKQISGNIELNPDYSFDLVLFTNKLKGEQVLTLKAKARNGTTAETVIVLEEAESDIPGFRIDSSSGVLTLDWESIPGAEKYDLLFTEGAKDPASEGEIIRNVTPPLRMERMQEGQLYSFQLRAAYQNSRTYESGFFRSEITKGIVLTPETLTPKAVNGYEQVTLGWRNIPGINLFDILRSDNPVSDFKPVSEGIQGTAFIDRTVAYGRQYFYKIRPSLEGALASIAVQAESLAFPEEKTMLVGEFDLDRINDIAASGGYIYLADEREGVRIIDNSDKGNPVEISRFATDDARSLVVKGDRIYLADGERGLKIININDPRAPELTGSRKTSDANKLALNNNLVYVADGTFGIKVIDITQEHTPARTGNVKTDNAKDLVIDGNLLYLADGPGGLKIMSLDDENRPTEISRFECADALALKKSGNLIYLADRDFGVRIIDVTDISRPFQSGQILLKNIRDLDVNENYLLAVNSGQGLSIFDISDISLPLLFDSVEAEGAAAVINSQGYIYLTSNKGFKSIKSFTIGRSYVLSEYKTDGKSYDLTYLDDTLIIADHNDGIKIVESLDDSSSFRHTGTVSTTYAESVIGFGSRILIADGAGGLVVGELVLDEAGDKTVEVTSTIDLPGISKSVFRHKSKAYISAREEGLHILDLESSEIKTIQTDGSVQAACADDRFLCIADGNKGLRIYSNGNPSSPAFISTIQTEYISSVEITGNYVITGGKGGLSVIDISKPNIPQKIANYKSIWIEDLYVREGYLYAAAGAEGLLVFDISNPALPELVSSCRDVYAVGVEVSRDLAFVADIDGFKVVKILIPSWLKKESAN